MKKNFVYAMMSAIALTGAVSLTSCSSNEEVADVNPTYDGNSVHTDFAFNITKASKGITRMTADNTQETRTFLGMEHMYLFPFKGAPSDNKDSYLSFTGDYEGPSIQNKNFSLGYLTNTEISASSSRKIYSLSFPVGTDNFLFYGKATRGTSKTNFQAGCMTSSFFTAANAKADGADAVANTKDINFNLKQIQSSLGDDATKLAGYLTQIARTTDWAGTVDIVKNHTGENPGAYSSLADLYSKFTYITSDRCGSAEAITRTVLDLFKGARRINQESSVSAVQTIANAICTNIDTKYDGTVRVTVGASDPDPENWTAGLTGVNVTFPDNLDLPIGAVQLQYDKDTKTFSYKTSDVDPTDLTSFGIRYTDICYPAELLYFDNSPLRSTDVYKKETDFPNTPAEWDYSGTDDVTSGNNPNGFKTTDWSGTSVTPSTRAVAMRNNVNYGVALLESTVKLATTDALTDNKAAILGGSAENQTDISGTDMQVTGIIIGGQPASVGWKMVNKTTTFNSVIYDKDVQYETAIPTYTTDAGDLKKNYTIVLDNLTSVTGQSDVNFALQIKNGDEDFYGKNGMIPAGHTFYLVGQLKLSHIKTDRTIPDVTISSGNTVKRDTEASGYRVTDESTGRVFIQDYKTKANITISQTSLQNAYSCIPDLRSTDVVFGLSVDLTWESGMEFDVVL